MTLRAKVIVSVAVLTVILAAMLTNALLLVLGKVRPSETVMPKPSLALLSLYGNEAASHMLASLRLFNSPDPSENKKGFVSLNREYKNGSCYAAGKLGWAYQRGLGVEADLNRAIQLYEHAAKCGMTYWQILLSHAYAEGYLGLSRNQEVAAYWRDMQPKVHTAKYECWVANYYRDGIYPKDDSKLEYYSRLCNGRGS